MVLNLWRNFAPEDPRPLLKVEKFPLVSPLAEMPGTRRGLKASSATSEGKSQAAEKNPAGATADSEVAAQHRDM